VSVKEKAEVICQVTIKKTNASEPLMKCRKTHNRRRNRDRDSVPRIGLRARPARCSTGVRHEGGVILMEAWVRNAGTCRADAKGEAQAGSPRKRLSTDAGHRGGVARSRGESSVMEPDRRGVVVRCYRVSNS
jgi:hypothetical protein